MRVVKIGSITLFAVFVSQFTLTRTDPYYRRLGETLNINWVTSLPWDVANTLRAPLGAPLSLILTSGLALIMFFGLAVSPVYYLLGTPHRYYNLRDAIIDRLSITGKEDSRLFPKNATLDMILKGTQELPTKLSTYPNFLESFFWLMGEEEPGCQKLMVCHAHGFFNFLPRKYLKYYRIFSRKIIAIPEEFQTAVQVGLDDQTLCMQKYYKQCPKNLVNISKETFQNLIPTDLSFISKGFKFLQKWLED